MKKLIMNTIAIATLTGSMVSCTGGGGGGYYYEPDWWYNCYPVYDSWGYYLYDDCYWEYYNVAGEKVKAELDITAEVADIETFKLNRMAVHYAEKFGMSNDQALKVAKNVQDFTALKDRTEADIADFAGRLYGINPTEMVSAVSAAQVGNNEALDKLVGEAAANFNISTESTKALIQELHGNALEAAGINL